MKKNIFIFLVIMVSSTLHSKQKPVTNFNTQCGSNIPFYGSKPFVQCDTNYLPITIFSDHVKGYYPNHVIFTGNVDLIQGNSHLQADKIQLYQNKKDTISVPIRIVDALGNVYYDDHRIILKGKKGLVNLNTKDINIWEGSYHLVGHQGHGEAKLMKQHDQGRYFTLKNGFFTSCSSNSGIWKITGKKILYDREKYTAEIWQAHLKFGSIPIFYSPYLRLPIGDKRHSGFLFPTIKYNNTSYFNFYLPYYWNIAPNIDITISPNYMYKHRNIIWKNSFRYLTRSGISLVEFDYLPSSKIYKNSNLTRNNHNRWLFHWKHTGVLNKIWDFNIDYTKVSDPIYFNDFNSKHYSGTENYVTQIFNARLLEKNFNATLSIKRFQMLNQASCNSYAAKPQLDVNWYKNNLGLFNFHIYGQITHFVNTASDMPESIRLHFEPSINIPWINNWVKINTEAKIISTHYQQKNFYKYNKKYNTNLKRSVNRVLPQFKINSKMMLKRDMNWKHGYTQTLEPHVQYLYLPYYDQKKIKNYDSSFPFPNYNSLLCDRTYSGLDRISSANQIKAGFTTRIYDRESFERLNCSIGKIYYLSESHTCSDTVSFSNKTGPLVWIGNIHWYMKHLGVQGKIQYDKRLERNIIGNFVFEYHRDKNNLIQLNYRYTNPMHYNQIIASKFSNYENNNFYKKKTIISQIGAVTNWSITNNLSMVGMYYYSTSINKPADQMIGLQYNSCCYAVAISYERKLSGWNEDSNQSKYSSNINFNIELRGLNSTNSINTKKMLRSSILPYQNYL